MQLPELIEPFVGRLERLGIPYMVTGSTAGILYGEPRMTHDVDIVIALEMRDVDRFIEAFPHTTGFKADIYIAFDELHRWGLAHRRAIQLDTRNSICATSAEAWNELAPA